MRGILIVNPHATTTASNTPELVTRSLGGLVDLDVRQTSHRGHARELAAESDADLVLVLGGDGAVNEAVNGIMARSPGSSGAAASSGALEAESSGAASSGAGEIGRASCRERVLLGV